MGFPTEDEDRIEENDREEPELEDPGQDERDIEVDDKDGHTEVEVHRETRRERKEREFAERRRKEIDEAVGPLRQQNAELRRMFSEFMARGQQTQVQQQQQRQQQNDDLDPDFEAIVDKQAAILAKIRNAKDDAEADRLARQYRKLDQDKFDLRAEKITEKRLANVKPAPQQTIYEQQLRHEYGDVFANQQAEQYALALVQAAQAEMVAQGKTWTPQVGLKIRQDALQKAGVVFRIRQPETRAPKASEAARFANRGGNAGQRPSSGGSVKRTLTPDERKAAMAAGDPDDAPEVRIKKWTARMEKMGYWDE